MKKLAVFLAFVLVMAGILSGCGAAGSSGTSTAESSGTTSSGKVSSGTATSGAESSGTATSGDESSGTATSGDGFSETVSSEITSSEPGEEAGELVILYTNDVHCGIDDEIGYAGLEAYRKELLAAGKTVLVTDSGDSIQGATLGAMTKGEAIVEIMNAIPYDVATLGNHEFDYGIPRLLQLIESAKYPYVCCNFTDLRTGELVLEPYVLKEAAGRKLAFIGVATPDSLTTSTPTYFMDENGEYIYGFCQEDGGKALYEAVQKAVDSARKEGAEICILVAHLGIANAESPFNAMNVIANISGVDIVLDGHSHSVVESEKVKDKEGKTVLYSQTGTKLAKFGELTIAADGSASTRLISSYDKKDEEINALIGEIWAKFEETLNENVGKTAFDLSVLDENGNRIVRNAETNLGNLSADAIRAATGAEIAFDNGGNVRKDILAGEITFGDVFEVHPFVIDLVTAKVSGQVIADALECSVSKEPEEYGGFLQVSGLTYTVDLSVPSGVVRDAEGMITEIAGERRVKEILVGGEPLDPERIYTVGGTAYVLLEKGDGHTAFEKAEEITPVGMTDTEALEKFIRSFPNGAVPETYADRYGEGRVTILGSEAK